MLCFVCRSSSDVFKGVFFVVCCVVVFDLVFVGYCLVLVVCVVRVCCLLIVGWFLLLLLCGV